MVSDAMKLFHDDDVLFKVVEARVWRSLAQREELIHPENADVCRCLKQAIAEHRIVIDANSLGEVEGLKKAYQCGWLQSEMHTKGLISYAFPSPLHHWFVYSRTLL